MAAHLKQGTPIESELKSNIVIPFSNVHAMFLVYTGRFSI